MEVLFVSNNKADWGNSPSTVTTSGYYDSARVPYAIQMLQGVQVAMKSMNLEPAASGDTIWYHWRHRLVSSMGNSQDGVLISLKDSLGAVIIEIDLLNGGAGAKVYGDTTVQGTYSAALSNGSNLEMDLKCVVNGSGITATFYLGQVLVGAATALNTGGLGLPRTLTFVNSDSLTGYVTEFLVAADDTRNARVDRIDPSSEGNYTAWPNGAFGDLGDDDDSSAMSTETATDRHSFNTDTYTGGSSVAAVVLMSRASAGSGAPQDLTLSLRIGSTDYDGSAQTLTTSLENYLEVWEIDPSDSLAWDQTGVNAIEVGMLAST